MNFLSLKNLGFPESYESSRSSCLGGRNTATASMPMMMQSLPASSTFGFEQLPFSDPTSFVHSLKDSKGPEKYLMNFKKGTTTLSFKFQGGVIVAVDSRASQGNFDASESVRKVIEINNYLLGTLAGGAADCQFWESYLAIECRKYELQYGERVSVATASRILVNILYGYRNHGLSIGCMLTGWDNKGPQLFYIDNEGQRIEGNMFSCGSGSTYAYGVLELYYKYDMSFAEAVELGKRAIYHAAHRDAASGGVVRIYHVHEKGWSVIEDGKDVNDLHYEYAAEKNLPGDNDEVRANLL